MTECLVLVVDDEPMIRMLLAESLSGDGYRVEEASSGDKAWELVERGLRPDVLVTDVRMPGSIDGLELARRMKSAHNDVPIIVMSGFIGEGAVDPSVAQFIPKPFVPSKISSLINEMR